MQLTLFQFLLVFASFVFFLMVIDAYQRRKFTFLHFFVFFGGFGVILVFSLEPDLLNKFGRFFGVANGSDLLVYIAIILLLYFYFELLHLITKDKYALSKLIMANAINDAKNNQKLPSHKPKKIQDDFVFLVRVYNESHTVGDVIDNILAAGFTKVITVNDGSTDNSLDILLQKKKKYKDKLVIISHTINRGGGAANKTGFRFIQMYGDQLNVKRVVTFDADGQMDVADMNSFIQAIKQTPADVYLGSRFIPGGSSSDMPLLRRIILKGSIFITYMFGGGRRTDPHNGYRVFDIDAIKKIRIYSDGMTYASEILNEIKNKNLKVIEVPVNISYTDYSKSKGQKNSNAFKILWELIYKKFLFK